MKKPSFLENITEEAGLWLVIGAGLLALGAILYFSTKIFSDIEQKVYENVQPPEMNSLYFR